MAMRCLIVDDSAVFLSAASTLLEIEGVSVTVASNSSEALRLIDEVDPDVVLVDVDLGDERGSDLVTRLAGRIRPCGSAVQTILMSMDDPKDLEELVAASSALGFLSKSALSADAIRVMMNPDHGGHRGAG